MTWPPIVAGLDASPEAAQGAELAWRIAAAAQAPYHLVHAVRDVRSAMFLAIAPGVIDELQSLVNARALAEIRRAQKSAVPDEALSKLEAWVGRPAVALGEAATRYGAGLVVLGAKRHSPPGRWLGGSTVQNVVRHLPAPLLVTAGAPSPIRRILVAVDLSAAASPTIEGARRFAALFGGEMRALHVIEPLPIVSELPPPIDPKEYADACRQQLEHEVWPLLTDAAGGRVVRDGVWAAQAIAAEARGWDADVIVVGSHGRRGLSRWVLGSVTEQLLHHAPSSVLVVPAPVAPVPATEPALTGMARVPVPA
ncbi:MAG TPA: universal stress protein [Gemmatimonadales bacterium]